MKIYQLFQDNEIKGEFAKENDALAWLQKHTCYSWDHAFKYEGWKLKEKQLHADPKTAKTIY